MGSLIASVDAAQDAEALATASARPTVVQREEGLQTMIIRDEDASQWEAGTYRLLVRCAGEGVLVAHFSIGGESVIRQLTPCSPTMSTDTLDLTLDRAASPSVVMIVPAGESMAAVGYQIQKVG